MAKVTMPFEHFDLAVNTFEELMDFLMLKVEPHDIMGIANKKVDRFKVIQSRNLVKVQRVGVGTYTNNQLLQYSTVIFDTLDKQLLNFKENRSESISEKIEILESRIESCLQSARYFDSMNSVRFASRVRFHLRDISYYVTKRAEDEDVFPLILTDLSDEQWRYIREAMSMRREIFYDVYLKMKSLCDDFTKKINNNSKYKLRGKTPQHDIIELHQALIRSQKIEFLAGDEKTLLEDLSKFFNVTIRRKAYTTEKVLERVKPAAFLHSLIEALEMKSEEFKIPKKKSSRKNKP